MAAESKELYSNDDPKETSLKDLIFKTREWWRYLLSNWLIILLFSALGGAAGLTYSYFKKPIYTATTTFVLEDEKSGVGSLGNLAGLASMAGFDLGGTGGGIFQGDNILGLYKSRTMLQRTLLTPIEVDGKKQMLIDHYIAFNKLKEKWSGNPELLDLKFSNVEPLGKNQYSKSNRLRDSVIGLIVTDLNREHLSVTKPDKKLSSIQVDVKVTDEVFAKAFNDELVKNVNEFYISTKTKKTLQNVQILQHKTDSVRSVMNGAIYTAVAVADATPNLNPTRQVQRVAPAQRAQFSAESNKAVYIELIKNLELAKLSLLKEKPLIQVVDQPIFPLKKDRMTKAKGLVNGVIIAGLLITIFLILRRVYRQAIA